MKRRLPANLSSAASQISEALGPERVAQLVGRSPTLVYKWADPDLAYFPNLQQALELDSAFVAAGHGAPPFLTAYATLLKLRTATMPQRKSDALSEAVAIVNVACEILSEVSGQLQASTMAGPPKSVGRCGICENLRKLGELQSALSWKMEFSDSEVACPLRRRNAVDVECSIGKQPTT